VTPKSGGKRKYNSLPEGDEGSAPLKNARGVLLPTFREVYKTRDDHWEQKKFIRGSLHPKADKRFNPSPGRPTSLR